MEHPRLLVFGSGCAALVVVAQAAVPNWTLKYVVLLETALFFGYAAGPWLTTSALASALAYQFLVLPRLDLIERLGESVV